jgi:hypothetical protein
VARIEAHHDDDQVDIRRQYLLDTGARALARDEVVRGSTLSISARVASARRAQSGICAQHALALGDALWRFVQADSDDGDLDDFNPARLIAI